MDVKIVISKFQDNSNDGDILAYEFSKFIEIHELT